MYPETLAYKNGSINDDMWRLLGKDGRISVPEHVRVLMDYGGLYIMVKNSQKTVIMPVHKRVSWAFIAAITSLRA